MQKAIKTTEKGMIDMIDQPIRPDRQVKPVMMEKVNESDESDESENYHNKITSVMTIVMETLMRTQWMMIMITRTCLDRKAWKIR